MGDQLDLERGVPGPSCCPASRTGRIGRKRPSRPALGSARVEIVREMAQSHIGDFVFPGQKRGHPFVHHGAADAVADA